MILSMPATLAASSATDLILLPAKNPVIEPPSFCAAVIEPREPWLSLPSFCSRTAREDSNRESAEREAAPVLIRNCVRAWRNIEWPAREIIASVEGEKRTTSSTFWVLEGKRL